MAKRNLNQLYYPTQNDEHFKITNLVLGGLLILGSFIWIFKATEYNIYGLIGVLDGVILGVDAMLNTQRGHLLIRNNKIEFDGSDCDFGLKQIKISDHQIVLIGVDDKKLIQENLKLDKEWKQKLTRFISDKINVDIEVLE